MQFIIEFRKNYDLRNSNSVSPSGSPLIWTSMPTMQLKPPTSSVTTRYPTGPRLKTNLSSPTDPFPTLTRTLLFYQHYRSQLDRLDRRWCRQSDKRPGPVRFMLGFLLCRCFWRCMEYQNRHSFELCRTTARWLLNCKLQLRKRMVKGGFPVLRNT